MFGRTPPWAMVTPDISLLSSSSFLTDRVSQQKYTQSNQYLMASCKCLGMMRDFLLSLAAFPASSRISAAKYSITAAM